MNFSQPSRLHRIFATLCICSLHIAADAQAPTGSIEGTVQDPSGAAIVGAAIKIADRNTGAQIQSRGDGRFQVPSLPTGDYSVEIASPGFAGFIESSIHLSAGDTVRVVAKLTLASLTQTATVAVDAATIDVATNTLGKTVTQREIVDLSLNGRNFRNWVCCRLE